MNYNSLGIRLIFIKIVTMCLRKNSFLFVLTGVLLFSCSSEDDDSEMIEATITYDTNIKSIIDNNCTVCHGSPTTQGAPMSLTTYTEVKSAVETRDLIGRVNSSSNPMPQSGLMTLANRDLIQQWKDDGLLEN